MHRQAGQGRDHADAIFQPLAHADNAAAADIDAGGTHIIERVETILIGPRGDDLAVILGRGIEIMVVVVEAGLFKPLRLRRLEHAERDAGFQTHRLHALDHGANLVEIAVLRRTPSRTHTKARRAAFLGRTRFGHNGFDRHQLLGFDAGVVLRRLRAIGAVFRAATGLDRQQGRDLHLGRIEILPVDLGGAEHQFRERQREQRPDLLAGPVVPQQA